MQNDLECPHAVKGFPVDGTQPPYEKGQKCEKGTDPGLSIRYRLDIIHQR
jgi:hypothetical protein